MKSVEEKKTFKSEKEKTNMAYFCRLCQCWHYPGSDVHKRHKIHASQRHAPKEVVRRSPRREWRLR